MKQHMLTHKIRDGCREPLPDSCKSNGTSASGADTSSASPSLATPLPSTLASPLPSSLASPLPSSLASPLPATVPPLLTSSLPPAAVAAALLHQAREEEKMVDSRLKREREGENALPVPKRASGEKKNIILTYTDSYQHCLPYHWCICRCLGASQCLYVCVYDYCMHITRIRKMTK